MSTNPTQDFQKECSERVSGYADSALSRAARDFMLESIAPMYSYNFSWMARPIIQYPQDVIAMQEIIWRVRPDLIIETGIAHGGSLIFSASMLALIEYCEAIEDGASLDPRKARRRVLGVDIDIRPHNRAAIEAHPLANRIDLIQGSSTAPEVVARVREMAKGCERVLVCLDSNHTHEHVLGELEAYAPLVSVGSYCVVFDTIIEDLHEGLIVGRPWGKGNNPKTAVREYLKGLVDRQGADPSVKSLQFEIDQDVHDKLLITVAPDGYLRRTA